MSQENVLPALLMTDLSFNSFSKQNCQKSVGSSLLNVRMSCFSLLLMIVNEEPFGFGLSVSTKGAT